MKMFKVLASLLTCAAILSSADAHADPSHLKIGMVNFKTCVEQSKQGKAEQATFDNLKKQMESVLAEKEKTLNEMSSKLNDADYLDSLSPEAETELKRKFRSMSQAYAEQQNQYLQTLQQTNFKVIQNLTELVSKAADAVAKKEHIDVIFNEEACFYCSTALDVSPKVIAILDTDYEKEGKDKKTEAPAPAIQK
jgi:outer membrane protein